MSKMALTASQQNEANREKVDEFNNKINIQNANYDKTLHCHTAPIWYKEKF